MNMVIFFKSLLPCPHSSGASTSPQTPVSLTLIWEGRFHLEQAPGWALSNVLPYPDISSHYATGSGEPKPSYSLVICPSPIHTCNSTLLSVDKHSMCYMGARACGGHNWLVSRGWLGAMGQPKACVQPPGPALCWPALWGGCAGSQQSSTFQALTGHRRLGAPQTLGSLLWDLAGTLH